MNAKDKMTLFESQKPYWRTNILMSVSFYQDNWTRYCHSMTVSTCWWRRQSEKFILFPVSDQWLCIVRPKCRSDPSAMVWLIHLCVDFCFQRKSFLPCEAKMTAKMTTTVTMAFRFHCGFECIYSLLVTRVTQVSGREAERNERLTWNRQSSF